MKIDFLAQYRDVARVLETPLRKNTSVGAKTADFAQLLADIDPAQFKKQPTKQDSYQSVDRTAGAATAPSGTGAMARFAFPEAPVLGPKIERISPVGVDTKFVNEAAASVKTSAVPAPKRGSETTAAGAEDKQRVAQVAKLIEHAGARHGIDPLLGLAVVEIESAFNPQAVSRDGWSSKGLFQLLDRTGQQRLEQSGSSQSYDPFDPEMNVDLGVGYLRYLHDLFSRDSALSNSLSTRAAANSSSLEKLAVAAFNAGEGRVASAQEHAAKDGKDPAQYEQIAAYLPGTTQEYVKRIMLAKGRFEGGVLG